jgi:mono/diheme cytochrome c family protein
VQSVSTFRKKREFIVPKRIIGILLPIVACLGAATAQERPAAAGSGMEGPTPLDRVRTAPMGGLKNPYTGDKQAIEDGRRLFFDHGCHGCHGSAGGGGTGPPINNEVWIYGSDDDTLFRLIALGSDQLQRHGYFRREMDTVVAPMPPAAQQIKSEDELWKVIAFVRSLYIGALRRKDRR